MQKTRKYTIMEKREIDNNEKTENRQLFKKNMQNNEKKKIVSED